MWQSLFEYLAVVCFLNEDNPNELVVSIEHLLNLVTFNTKMRLPWGPNHYLSLWLLHRQRHPNYFWILILVLRSANQLLWNRDTVRLRSYFFGLNLVVLDLS